MNRRLATLLLVATVAASLTACGRRSQPSAPEGSTYPRVYPPVVFPDEPAPGTGEQSDDDTGLPTRKPAGPTTFQDLQHSDGAPTR